MIRNINNIDNVKKLTSSFHIVKVGILRLKLKWVVKIVRMHSIDINIVLHRIHFCYFLFIFWYTKFVTCNLSVLEKSKFLPFMAGSGSQSIQNRFVSKWLNFMSATVVSIKAWRKRVEMDMASVWYLEVAFNDFQCIEGRLNWILL